MIKQNPVKKILLKLILVLRKKWEDTEFMVTHATINKSWRQQGYGCTARVGNLFLMCLN